MKVVIVGGGFGGVQAALSLSRDERFDVQLISDKSHFEYHAGLYRTATGRSPLETVVPLTEIFATKKRVSVHLDKITTVDAREKTVRSELGNYYRYDNLIIATGNVTNYFGIKGLAEHSLGIKSLSDALHLREHLHTVITSKKGARPIHYVVVGGGPTGVELAAELAYYLKRLCKQHRVKPKRIKIDLVEAAPTVLPMMMPRFSRRVARRLKKLGIRLYLNKAVEQADAENIIMPKAHIKTTTIVWTAGTTNNPLLTAHPKLFELGKGGKVTVGQHLEAADHIYVIGDNAATPYSGMAQTALYDADFVTNNLRRTLNGEEPLFYRPKRPLYAIPIGARWAAVRWGRFNFFGLDGWMIRRAADLLLLKQFLPVGTAWRKWRRGGAPVKQKCPKC